MTNQPPNAHAQSRDCLRVEKSALFSRFANAALRQHRFSPRVCSPRARLFGMWPPTRRSARYFARAAAPESIAASRRAPRTPARAVRASAPRRCCPGAPPRPRTLARLARRRWRSPLGVGSCSGSCSTTPRTARGRRREPPRRRAWRSPRRCAGAARQGVPPGALRSGRRRRAGLDSGRRAGASGGALAPPAGRRGVRKGGGAAACLDLGLRPTKKETHLVFEYYIFTQPFENKILKRNSFFC